MSTSLILLKSLSAVTSGKLKLLAVAATMASEALSVYFCFKVKDHLPRDVLQLRI